MHLQLWGTAIMGHNPQSALCICSRGALFPCLMRLQLRGTANTQPPFHSASLNCLAGFAHGCSLCSCRCGVLLCSALYSCSCGAWSPCCLRQLLVRGATALCTCSCGALQLSIHSSPPFSHCRSQYATGCAHGCSLCSCSCGVLFAAPYTAATMRHGHFAVSCRPWAHSCVPSSAAAVKPSICPLLPHCCSLMYVV